MTATPTPEVREFIIVGQCQGTGYQLWDIEPAPTNPARRAAVLEEIGVDAADAFGSVNTEHGATAREAVEAFLADMRKQSGLDDYGLAEGSQTDKLDEPAAATAHAAAAGGMATVTATVVPGLDSFGILGSHPADAGVSSQRIHGGLIRGRFALPSGQITVRIDNHRNVAGTLDLAIACAVLATAGDIDRDALGQVACIGEMGWDGYVESVYGIREAARTAHANGVRTILVPAAQATDVHDLRLGLDVIGVRHVREAADFLNRLAGGR